jgi:hypothetical protein
VIATHYKFSLARGPSSFVATLASFLDSVCQSGLGGAYKLVDLYSIRVVVTSEDELAKAMAPPMSRPRSGPLPIFENYAGMGAAGGQRLVGALSRADSLPYFEKLCSQGAEKALAR